MANNEEQIKTLIEITGLDRDAALKVLLFKHFNVEHAINYVLDGGSIPDELPPTFNDGPGTSSALYGQSTSRADTDIPPLVRIYEDDDDDNVRPPIPPKRETMILPDEDNFRFRKRRIAHNICPLRNFEREGELLEEEMLGDKTTSTTSKSSKRVRLEDIFRPPVDICYWGPFQTAREYATDQNKWLIVNLQDQTEFLSQCLNRDIWSNIEIKNFIKKFFVFWQVSVDNLEGIRFKSFYCVKKCPYVCIIDPRTGEHKYTIDLPEMLPNNYINDFVNYLKDNGTYPLSTDDNNGGGGGGRGGGGCHDNNFSVIDGKIKSIDRTLADEAEASTSTSSSSSCIAQIPKNMEPSSSSASSSTGNNYNKILYNIPSSSKTPLSVVEAAASAAALAASSKSTSLAVVAKLQNEHFLSPFQSAPTYLFDNINITNTHIINNNNNNNNNKVHKNKNNNKNGQQQDYNKKLMNLDNSSTTITSAAAATDDDINKLVKKKSFDKLTEEEQIELAIKNSLNNASGISGNNTDIDDDDDDDDDEDDPSYEEDGFEKIIIDNKTNTNNKATTAAADDHCDNNDETYEDFLGEKNDPITKLSLRLPNDQREILELPCTSTIKALKLYVTSKYPDITKGLYKILVSTFPKCDILELNENLTLKEADLHPVAVIYIHPDD